MAEHRHLLNALTPPPTPSSPHRTGPRTPPRALLSTRPTCSCLPRLTPRPLMKSNASSWRTCPPTTGSGTGVLAAISFAASHPLAPCAQRSRTTFRPQQALVLTLHFDTLTADASGFLQRRSTSPLGPTHILCTLPYAAQRQPRRTPTIPPPVPTAVSAPPSSQMRRPSATLRYTVSYVVYLVFRSRSNHSIPSDGRVRLVLLCLRRSSCTWRLALPLTYAALTRTRRPTER